MNGETEDVGRYTGISIRGYVTAFTTTAHTVNVKAADA